MTKITQNQMNVPIDGSQYRDKIDLTKFEDVIPKSNEFLQTRHFEKLLEYGVTKPFNIWLTTDDTGTSKYYLMSNHSDFRFSLEHCLPFQIVLRHFLNEQMVIKFNIEDSLSSDTLSMFQKGMMVLKNKAILMIKSKENMVKGGKGIKIDKQSHTLKILSSWIGCSHTTLQRVDYLLKNLKDESLLKKLEYNEVSISKTYKSLKKQINDSRTNTNYFSDKQKQLESMGLGIQSDSIDPIEVVHNTKVQKPKYHINEDGKYPIVYIDTKFNNTRIKDVQEYVENLKQMNIREVVYHKFCTMFIQTSPMFLSETIDIINSWGFNCVDSKTVTFTTEKFKTKYSKKYSEIILFCEKNNVGVQSSYIKNPIETSTMSHDTVLELIDEMFEGNLSKLGVFIDSRDGWDTFNFDEETQDLVKFYKKVG